jgi:hypothetical protein
MTDRSFKIYQGEDNSPVTDMTDESTNSMAVNIRWEDAEFGTRAYRGESTNSNITVNDPNGVTGNEIGLPGGLTRVSLASRNVLEFVHGSNILWRGRMATKDYSRGEQRASRYREAAAYLEDINLDLRGIVVHGWSRPAETDVARLQGLIASYLWGNPRRTTKINGSNLLNAGSNVINLPAKTYDQTTTAEVIEEIAQAAGKTYHLLPRRRTTDVHTAELYYDGNDAVLEQCPYRITDREDEVRASPRAHFYPWWNVGPASTENGQEMLSGIWLFYGVESYVHVSDAVQANLYSFWEEVIFDGDIDTEAEATARAQSILAQRKYEERTYNVTIGPLDDTQIGGIRAGQHIYIKARAIPDADDAYANRKISQLKVTTPMPGMYFAHLQLDRPLRAGAHGTGSPVGPKPPTPPSVGGSVRLYPSNQSSGASGIPEAGAAPNLVWLSDADADWDIIPGGDYHYMFDDPANTTSNGDNVWAAVNAAAGQHVIILGEVHRLDGELLAIIQSGGTIRGQFRASSRNGLGISEAAQIHSADQSVRVYRPGVGFVATLLGVGDSGSATTFLAQSTPVNRLWTGTISAYPSAVDGDYIVVDLGIRHDGPATGGTGAGMYYNDATGVASDLPEDQVETENLRAWIEFRGSGTAGSGNPSPTVEPGEETPGTDNDHYAPYDHAHAHGFLADDGVHMHDADQIDGLDDLDTSGFVTTRYGGKEVIADHGAMGASEDIDLNDGNVHIGELDANLTLTFAAVTSGVACSFVLGLFQDGTGGRTLTLPASVVNDTELEGALDTDADSITWYTFWTLDGGTTWYGVAAGGAGGGASELDDLTDVTITSPATAERLRFNGTQWVNSALKWVPVTTYDGTNWLPAVDGDGNAIVTET